MTNVPIINSANHKLVKNVFPICQKKLKEKTLMIKNVKKLRVIVIFQVNIEMLLIAYVI